MSCIASKLIDIQLVYSLEVGGVIRTLIFSYIALNWHTSKLKRFKLLPIYTFL